MRAHRFDHRVHRRDRRQWHKTLHDSNAGGEREVQRFMHERLNQLEGFDSRGDVKVLPAINRIGSLGPALIRHGRIDWKIEHAL
ncbi:hypothetical protein AAVH_42855, partial [Aphelenchoides avenae]